MQGASRRTLQDLHLSVFIEEIGLDPNCRKCDEIIGGQMKRAFFLGAGATIADFPQAPLNDRLLGKLLEINSNETKTAKDIVKDFLKKFFNVCNSGSLPRIEDVLSFLDSSLRRKFYCKDKDYDREKFLKVRMSLVYLMGQLLKDELEGNGQGVAERFCDGLTEEDVIISTNYDIVMDNALWRKERELNVNYGEKVRYSGSFPESHDEGKVIFERDSKTKYLNQGKIKLLKIHGSLNFLYCPECEAVDVTVGEKGIVYCMHRNLEVKCSNHHCTGKYEDLIITPTFFKIYTNPFLKRIWRMAEDAISTVDEIIFIGYSMPDADIEIKCMLLRGIARNTNCPKIIVVDKDKSKGVKDRYEKLFGKITFDDCGFERYLAGLCRGEPMCSPYIGQTHRSAPTT